MNITEEDVRSELDRHGLGDSRISIGKESVTVQGKKHWYKFFASHVLYKLTSGIGVHSMVIEKHIESTEIFPKEHRPMCRSIVRLITGEKQQEKIEIVEASVEDKMLAILADHEIEQSDEEIEKTRISEEGFARIYASEMVIVIQPVERLMHISELNQVHTYTHSFAEWNDRDSHGFKKMCDIKYTWWLDHLKPALFEIIETLESPESTPEKSLEEKVRVWIEPLGGVFDLSVTSDSIEFSKKPVRRVITKDSVEVTYLESCIRSVYSHREYLADYGNDEDEVLEAVCKLIRLMQSLADQAQEDQPTPTYTELEQRVRELEEQLIQERESHIQQGSVEGQKREALEKRVAELEEQLQSSVSEADHEAEIEKWSKAFEGKRKEALNHFRRANKYQRWWETEYAKNAGVSQ